MDGSGRNRLLKILHVDPEKNWGGGEAQVLGLLSYLAEKGHQNALLAHPRGRLIERCRNLNLRTLPLRLRNDLDWMSIPALRGLIRREKYDIVHFHTKRAHALSVWLPRAAGCPKYVVTRRMDYPERRNGYTRYLYNRGVDGVIAISGTIRDLLIDTGVSEKRIRVIHSGIDALKFAPIAAAVKPAEPVTVIGTLAVLEERKGHRYLFEAAAMLKAKGLRVKYLVAGAGSLQARLEETVKRLNLREEVRFVGFVSDVAGFFREIDIFVLASLHEGLGVAALEAMAAGKSVIATQVGGLVEVVMDSVSGFLVTPADAEGLAGAIETLVRNRNLARAMGENGAARVRECFTLEQMAAANERFYYDLLDGFAG